MLVSLGMAGGLKQIFWVSMRILSEEAFLFSWDTNAGSVRYDCGEIVDKSVFLGEGRNLYLLRDIFDFNNAGMHHDDDSIIVPHHSESFRL